MFNSLEFKTARCKDCYKCLRECPVKAIEYIGHQAKIIENRCILCGKCTRVCPQNAKKVHSEKAEVLALLQSEEKVYASVAPSFISSFHLDSFEQMSAALKTLGFSEVEETAIGANAVTKRYDKLLREGEYENFITSACPAVNTLIELYYPKALPFLARVDSPMVAHAKIIKEKDPNAKIVFIGPCIAKKKEAFLSGIIDGVLTFEDLDGIFQEKNITFSANQEENSANGTYNKARCYPISRGIIKSFENGFVDNYEYLAVDGVSKCMEVLENIESYSGMFLELNACEYACVNGPCALIKQGNALKANADVRKYVNKNMNGEHFKDNHSADISKIYPKIEHGGREVLEYEITEILRKTGKFTPEDELDCGACGYNTCRDKAWAVANGYAELEMCLPWMKKRSESMSYEIIRNSPNGIAVIDYDLKLQDVNDKARELWGIGHEDVVGEDLVTFCDPGPMLQAVMSGKNVHRPRIQLDKTKKYIDMTVTLIKEHKIMFIIMRDTTERVLTKERMLQVKMETLQTTDDVIKKQMRVAQEIASLLGETTAETKVALLKLKKTMNENSDEVK